MDSSSENRTQNDTGSVPKSQDSKRKSWEMPPVLAILFAILIVSAIARCVLPQGSYERVEKRVANRITYIIGPGDTREEIAQTTGATLEDVPESLPPAGQSIVVPVGGMTRSVVVPGTYQRQPIADEKPWIQRIGRALADLTLAPIEGFIERSQIIGFVLILGGSFGVILSSGAIDQGLHWLVSRLSAGGVAWVVIPVCFTLFSLGGAIFGMGESTIAFVLITVPLALRLGYDSITGIAICYMASQVGFAAAFFNPFTIGIAQGIAELPYLSGMTLRYIVWSVMTLVGIIACMWWASRVRRNPQLSPVLSD